MTLFTSLFRIDRDGRGAVAGTVRCGDALGGRWLWLGFRGRVCGIAPW